MNWADVCQTGFQIAPFAQLMLKNPDLKTIKMAANVKLFESKIKSDIFVALEKVLVGLNRVNFTMLRSQKFIAALLLGFFVLMPAMAQNTQSAYSVYGVGDPNWGGYSHNSSMGGLGVTYNNRFYTNNINPALTATTNEAIFQFDAALDYRTHANGVEKYSGTTAGFKDLSINLPIKLTKWNIGINLSPYSNVKYAFTQSEPGPEGSTAITEVSGVGGLDEAAVTNAFRFGNLLIGAKISYIFGSIQEEDRFYLEGLRPTSFGTSVVNGVVNFGQITASGGFVYKAPISDLSRLNIGGFYNPEVTLKETAFITLENQASGGNVFSTDTLVNNLETQVLVPERFGFGISYERFQKLAIGVDFQTQDWTKYRRVNGTEEPNFGQAFRIAVGGELLPNFQSPKYLGRISYRFGVHYERTPYLVNNDEVNDLGISFGAALPLNAFWGLSHINVGATIGQRGDTSNGKIREDYIKVYLGFSLQDVTWFARQKFN